MEKTMKARIQHKHDIEANWLKATNFIPLTSEIIVYDPDENYDYPRIKIGDGETNINALPFVTKDYAKISDIPTKPEDIGALPDSTVIPTVPTKISAFENDKGYLTQHQSLDAYAKTADLGALATKDSLTASDVGALPDTTKIPSTLADLTADSTHRTVTDTEKNTWNTKANASDIPTKVSDLTNDKGYITSYTETDPTVPSWAKAATKPSYTASEVGALPSTTKIPGALSDLSEDTTHRVVTDAEKEAWNAKSNFSGNYADLNGKPTIPTVPTKISAFENDAKYLTTFTETDPTVPDWAKAKEKPTYTADEVGALPDSTEIPSKLSDLNEDASHRLVTDTEKATWNAKSNFSGSYNDLTNKPTIPSITGLASTTYVDDAVKNKVDKDGNKVLSTNDYTTAEKNKLANIAAGAEVNVNADWNATSGDAQILNKPTLGSMAAKSSVAKSDLASGVQTSLSKADSALQPGDISDWAKQSSKPSYTKSEVGLGNVDNTSDANKPVSTAQANAIAEAKKAGTDAQSNLTTHTNNKSNPHGVTKTQVGLGNVDNVKQYSAENPPVVAQDTAPTDTSVIWVDTDDDSMDDTQFISYEPQTLTEAQKAQARQNIGVDIYVTEELAKRGQLKPEFAESEEWLKENGDTTKLYVVDGSIYAYMLTEVESGATYNNVLSQAINADKTPYIGTNGEKGYKTGWRINSSRVEKQDENCCCTGFIRVNYNDTIRVKNMRYKTGNGYIHFYAEDFSTNTGQAYEYDAATQIPIFSGGESIIIPSKVTDWGGGNKNATEATYYMRISTGVIDDTSIITINEEIIEGGTSLEYAWVNTGYSFISTAINNALTMYISPEGNDGNDGLTSTTPKKTVKACVNAGATKISAKRGVYNEYVHLYDIDELEIIPTDNDLIYEVGEERSSIIFDTSDTIVPSNLTDYNSIKKIAYSNSKNVSFDKVFVSKTVSPIANDYGARYYATIWLLSNDGKSVCNKLKPVLTIAECEAEVNTFSYIEGYIYINANMTNVEKIIIPTNWGQGFLVDGANRVILKEVEVRFSNTYNIDIKNCVYFDFYKCACKYSTYASGFHPYNSNGVMTACYATKNFDGYGISGYGHTTYIDCVSEFNFDDGMSHHDGTSGTVIGGRYEGNGKGGNTPAYGANVNIYGGIYKDNGMYGIGYLWASGFEPANGTIQNVVMIDNAVGLNVDANCTVTATDCIYYNNITDKSIKGNLTEIEGSYTTDSGINGDNSNNDNTIQSYTNVLPTATMGDDQAAGWVEGGGYTSQARLSGSGGNVVTNYTTVAGIGATGYITGLKVDDVIRIKGFYPPSGASTYVVSYNGTTKVANMTFSPVNNVYSGDGTWQWTDDDGAYWYTIDKLAPVDEVTATIKLTSENFGSDFNAIRISGIITENTIITINEEIVENTGNNNDNSNGVLTDAEKLELIKNWDAPIYDANIPVFQLSTEKAAMTNAAQTPNDIYAKYDALMAKHPHYITKTDLGLCSDGTNHVYRYDFREPDSRHTSGYDWSETKSKAIIVSGIHYEWAGIYGLYYALEEIAENPALYHLRRNTHLIVVPCMNPYCTISENYTDSIGVLNANGVQIHRNFEVGFIYPGQSGYVEAGNRNHGGTAPLSEIETQYVDNIMKENTDAAFFLTCHSFGDKGFNFIWPSTATSYMCNMGYRLIDKLSNVWMDKYGDEFVGLEEYRTDDIPSWDNRLGFAHISKTDGTETRQATKYGIQGANVEINSRFWVHGTESSPEPSMSSFTMSRGAEVYVNFLLTAFDTYDPKDKKLYS